MPTTGASVDRHTVDPALNISIMKLDLLGNRLAKLDTEGGYEFNSASIYNFGQIDLLDRAPFFLMKLAS